MSSKTEAEAYAGIQIAQAGRAPGFEVGYAAARRISMIRVPHDGTSFGDPPADVYLLTTPLRGSPYVECEFSGYRIESRMHPGDFILQPMQEGCIGHADQEALIQIMAIDGPWFRALGAELGSARPSALDTKSTRTWRDDVVFELSSRLWRAAMIGGGGSQAWVDSAGMTIAGIIARASGYQLPQKGATPLSKAQMRRLEDFIDAHLGEAIGIAEMAAIVGLSPFYFVKAFKATRGQTPHRFLMMRRLQRARMLLEETDMPLAAIAYSSGFSSQAHLTTRFRETYGRPPGAFRRSRTA